MVQITARAAVPLVSRATANRANADFFMAGLLGRSQAKAPTRDESRRAQVIHGSREYSRAEGSRRHGNPPILFAAIGGQDALPQPERLRRHLDQLVLADELERLLEVHHPRRH